MDPLAIKPGLVRADTIDLQQSQPSASAKDHSRQYGYNHIGSDPGSSGAHHIQALRHAAQEAYSEQRQIPRVDPLNHSQTGRPSQLYDDEDDDDDEDTLPGMNGVHHDEDYGEDGDSQDELDDDLLDKISSSPSIEDGKSFPWPARADSLHSCNPPTRGMSLTPVPFPVGRNIPEEIGHHQSRTIVSIDFDRAATFAPVTTNENAIMRDVWQLFQSDSINDISQHSLPDPFLDDLDPLGANHSTDKVELENEWEDEDAIRDNCASSDDDQAPMIFTSDPRFLDSGWGGECLREIEDIDFEFVYALHTFVATVEGQANATKGDTMVLLDDSNSYWWLVRVVKDGSIGYLPAEHIETPTERLARLNKHRNIDLTAAMLGDDPTKPKNPLKKAMRRRNAKNVNFAPPTYYEPPEQDWSDDEEMDDADEIQLAGVQDTSEENQEQAQQTQQDPDNQRQAQELQQTQHVAQGQKVRQIGSTLQAQMAQPMSATVQQPHLEMLDDEDSSIPVGTGAITSQGQETLGDNLQRSRKGVVRNTDSFYKDDTVETKKISLTPQLLRGDSAINVNAEQEPRERRSAETLDKAVADEKPKDVKPKKEKKGMLSGLFKRKDKSGKTARSDDEERVSEDSARSPQSKESLESTDVPERKPSKLQKTAQGTSVTATKVQPPIVQASAQTQAPQTQAQGSVTPPAPTEPSQPSKPTHSKQSSRDFAAESQHPPGRFPSLNEKRSVFAPITTAIRSKTSNSDVSDAIKPVYSKRAKERFAIEDSDSEDVERGAQKEEENNSESLTAPTKSAATSALHRSISPLSAYDGADSRPDSMARVSPLLIETHMKDTLSAADVVSTPTSSTAKPSPLQSSQIPPTSQTPTMADAASPSEQTNSTFKNSPSTTQTSTTSRLTPTWSDASLRSYMDDDQDIRNLLIIVHDKSNVTPVGHDHPLMKDLFSVERVKLNDMQAQLDSMLTSWLAKKGQSTIIRA